MLRLIGEERERERERARNREKDRQTDRVREKEDKKLAILPKRRGDNQELFNSLAQFRIVIIFQGTTLKRCPLILKDSCVSVNL